MGDTLDDPMDDASDSDDAENETTPSAGDSEGEGEAPDDDAKSERADPDGENLGALGDLRRCVIEEDLPGLIFADRPDLVGDVSFRANLLPNLPAAIRFMSELYDDPHLYLNLPPHLPPRSSRPYVHNQIFAPNFDDLAELAKDAAAEAAESEAAVARARRMGAAVDTAVEAADATTATAQREAEAEVGAGARRGAADASAPSAAADVEAEVGAGGADPADRAAAAAAAAGAAVEVGAGAERGAPAEGAAAGAEGAADATSKVAQASKDMRVPGRDSTTPSVLARQQAAQLRALRAVFGERPIPNWTAAGREKSRDKAETITAIHAAAKTVRVTHRPAHPPPPPSPALSSAPTRGWPTWRSSGRARSSCPSGCGTPSPTACAGRWTAS